jgi:hypothetical protein
MKDVIDFAGEEPPAELPPVHYINVSGRKEHEALLKDEARCKELGIDRMFETILYFKRWGSWLSD